jgi:hypothetical protein
MWVTNQEYASQVNFCPYCGKEAEYGKRGSQEHYAHEAEINVGKLVKEHDPRETGCTKFLICIQDGEIRSYDGCHGDEQGVAHAATLINSLPSGSGDDRRVMLSIDPVPEDEEGMSEDEERARQQLPHTT